MTSPRDHVPVQDGDDRLDEVAELLAEAILRARLRRDRKRNVHRKRPDNPLALSAATSAHASDSSRDGEPA